MKGPFLINKISKDFYYSIVNRVAICPVLGRTVTMSTYQHTCLIQMHICPIYVTLDHKTSHKGQFYEIEIYTSYESWNK